MRRIGVFRRRGWPWVLLIVMIVAGGVTRLALSRTHFAHVDDIGVAAAILAAKSHPPGADDLLLIAREKQAEGSASPRVALLLDLERRGLWRPLHAIGGAVYPYVVVPLIFTYAPLQFVLTGALLDPGQDYARVKFLGRLPSVVFSMVSMALVALAALRLGAGGATALAALAVALIAFSGEHTTSSALMHSYVATSAASAALLLLVLTDTRPDWSAAFVIRRSCILITLLYLSYQTVMLLPGYFAALGLGMLKRNPRVHRTAVARQSAILVAVVALAFLPAYVFRVAGINAITYSAGPNREFVFRTDGGMLTAVSDAVQFVVVNSWIVMRALVSPVPDDSRAAAAMAAMVALGILAGLARMVAIACRSRTWSPPAASGVYSVVTLALLFAFVLSGRLTLAPTRHMLVYLPIIIVAAAYGWRTMTVYVFGRLVRGHPRQAWVALSMSLSIVLMGAYAGHLRTLFAERRDPFDEAELRTLVEDYQVEFVAADNAAQLLAMPLLMRSVPVRSTVDLVSSEPPLGGPSSAPRRILVVSQFDPVTERVCLRLQALLVARFGLAPWQPCLSRIRVRHAVAVSSDVQVEFSQRTENGTNGLYATVIDVIEP